MFRVSTVNLSPDGRRFDPQAGTIDLGELPADQLVDLLERFRGIDPVENTEAEPHITATGRAGKFLVRTGRGKLFLYNARDSIEPYAELTADEIVVQLERTAVTAPPFASMTATDSGSSPAVPPAPAMHRSAPHRGIAAAILVTGLALNGYTLYSVFYTESVNEQPAVTLVTDPAELASRQQELLGTYRTGEQPGDRIIAIEADGRIRFTEIGSKNSVVNNADAYRLGRRAGKYCLTTAESGLIDIVDIDTLTYYRDTYRRVR
jgi:hypothetical protein